MNTEYVKKTISKCDNIVIDTSSLLNATRPDNFLSNNKTVFINCNKKILVPNCVMAELAKFASSSEGIKRISALRALEVLRCNKDLFEFDDDYILPEGEDNFADPKILKILLENRRNVSQLLISNDHGLTSDAINFNKMESFYGNRINVCYLTYTGKMNMCDCVKENNKENIKEVIKTVEEEKVKIVKEDPSLFDKCGKPVLYFFGGMITAASIKPISKLIKNMM